MIEENNSSAAIEWITRMQTGELDAAKIVEDGAQSYERREVNPDMKRKKP